MKALSKIILLCTTLFLLASCGEDRTHEYLEMTQDNQWTFSKMREVYLWRNTLKKPERTAFFGTASKFFTSLLNKQDKTSFFSDSTSAGTYGLTFTVMRDPIGERPSKVYALVLNVTPGSPADKAGIERGTWIESAGGKSFTMSSYSHLQKGGSTTIVTAAADYDDETEKYFWATTDTIELTQSNNVAAPAVLLDTTYTSSSKSVGYIFFNNFNGTDFIEHTQELMLSLAAEEIEAIILDLRYCSNGTIENAVSLASTFVDTEKFNTPFCHLVDIDGNVDTTYNYLPQTTSLSDKRLYMLTGKQTAGVVELFTASLCAARSVYDAVTLGATTKGNNVITTEYTSPYGFSINPATSFLALPDSTVLPSTGLTPYHAVNELERVPRIYPLGDEQEFLLYNTLYLIENGDIPL